METTSRQPVTRSIWVLLAIAVLAVAAPTTSDAKPLPTCKSMCQRLTDCKLSSYTKMCLDACKQYGYEASEEGRAQLVTFTQYSCKQIQSALGASTRPPAPSNAYDDDGYDDAPSTASPSTPAQPADGDPSPRRGWLGLASEDPESGTGSQGVTVVDIQPGSPAATAGLRAGDQIGAVNGRPIGTSLELARRVEVLPPGTVLRLSVRRGNRVRDVAVTLGKPPAPIGSTNEARARPPAPAPVRSSGSSASSGSSNSGQWHCRAVGTYAPPSMSAPGPDYSRPQNIDVTNDGETRGAAISAALQMCGGLLTNKLLVMPDALVLDQCKVIGCSR